MSINVPTHFVQQYKTNVQLLLQQRGSKLRDKVMTDTYTGKAAKSVEQIGAAAAVKRTARHADTPIINVPADARWVFPEDYEWGALIDDQDKLRMLIDPTSGYATTAAYAIGRGMDDEIIDAFFGTSKTGENGTTNTTFPAAQQVASGATGLTLAKILEGKRLLIDAEVDLEAEMLFLAIAGDQWEDLMNIAEAQSIDTNTRKPLADGDVRNFVGINFVLTERLPVNGSSERRCPLWAQSGMHLGVWGDLRTRISERADKSYSTQVYAAATIGATRVEEKKVVEIPCAE